VSDVSIWYDSGIVYAVGDTSDDTNYVLVRRGVVDSGIPSITWGNEKQVWISTQPLANKVAFISKDYNERLWVAAPSYWGQQGGQDRYQIRTNQSDAADNVEGTWTDRGNLLTGTLPTDTSRVCLAPGTSASGIFMWAIYTSAGSVYSKTYVSGWVGGETIYSAGASDENTHSAPASAVMDADGVLHVVFGTGYMDVTTWKAQIQYTYNQGSGWSSPLTLNLAGNEVRLTPTISLDSSTGNVYAMWIEDTTTPAVIVMKNVSGTWDFVSITQSETNEKNHLNSIYSVPGESLVCMQWTEHTTGPSYNAEFEKIPEFSDIVLPVFFVLVIFIAAHRHRSRGSGRADS